ncbi:hypothetical protein [Acidithiobacillus thiooxidans]|uniref:hypothetical protein n=1 Tax=Acidithiobacillus thiooxidans TaxID=930 RepID=UPI0040376028
MRQQDHQRVSRTAVDFDEDFPQAPSASSLPFPSGLMQQASLRLFARAGYKPAATSPIETLRTFRSWSFHTLLSRLAHSRDGKQIERFRYRIPIFFRDQHSVTALAFYDNGLMRICGFIDKAVQLRSRLCRVEYGHVSPSLDLSVRYYVRLLKGRFFNMTYQLSRQRKRA